MGQIWKSSIIGETSMNPYISGQNSAKFWGEEIYPLAETVLDGGGKKCPYQSWCYISGSDVRGYYRSAEC